MKKHQKNFLKVPPALLGKIKGFKGPDIVVACVKRIPAAEIVGGGFLHLGIQLQNNKLVFPVSVLPPPESGRYSGFNVFGKTLVRKDRPKVPKSFTMLVPNFGDWSKGSHYVTQTRMVYRRDFFPPHEIEIKIELLEEVQKPEHSFVVKFVVQEVLNSGQPDFGERLLANINLLQENVGYVSVYPSDATRADFLQTVHIDWEILPVGDAGLVVRRLVGASRGNRVELERTILARQKLLESLGPVNWIIGTSGFSRYLGAKFKDNLVVFENIEYGNAIYVMFEKWAELSKRSRIDLLARPEGFVRIVHRKGWEDQLRKVIGDNLSGPEQKIAA
jgi:hypothetical protein